MLRGDAQGKEERETFQSHVILPRRKLYHFTGGWKHCCRCGTTPQEMVNQILQVTHKGHGYMKYVSYVSGIYQAQVAQKLSVSFYKFFYNYRNEEIDQRKK